MINYTRSIVTAMLNYARSVRRYKHADQIIEQTKQIVKDKMQDFKNKGQIGKNSKGIPYKVEPEWTDSIETLYDVYISLGKFVLPIGKLQYPPPIGATVDILDACDLIGKNIVYVVDSTEYRIGLGPQKITCPDYPLIEIDLHHRTLKCKKCQKIKTWKSTPINIGGAFTFDWSLIVDAARVMNNTHANCGRPICPN